MSGHLSMNSVLKNNRNLLRKKSLFSRNKDFENREGELIIKQMSKEELQLLNIKISKEQKKENFKLILIVSLIFIPVVLFAYTMFNDFVHYKDKELHNIYLQEHKQKQKEIKQLNSIISNKYNREIKEGDKWMESKNWKNAIFFYTNAVDLYPKKFEANYRLTLAYSYNCKYKKTDCETGKKQNDKLLKYFPDNEDLLKLKHIFDNN